MFRRVTLCGVHFLETQNEEWIAISQIKRLYIRSDRVYVCLHGEEHALWVGYLKTPEDRDQFFSIFTSC